MGCALPFRICAISPTGTEDTRKKQSVVLFTILNITKIGSVPRCGASHEFYDFIVVGGGTAACAIAGRLSENGRHSVLMLERGGAPLEALNVPALGQDVISSNPRVVRAYSTVSQANLGLQNNGIISFVTANLLGGGSSINAMFFNRGSPQDYDNWAALTGDSSWKYSNLLRLFKKLETYDGLFPSDQHGYSGPVHVSRPRYAPAINDTLNSGKWLGFPFADPNGPQILSFTPAEKSQHFGRRVSSYSAYIRPHLARKNLHVITNAEVSRVLFENHRAVGVVYSTGSGCDISVRAQKEVIISAGAINSPIILMKSGIGPKDSLERAGIPVIKELPVGQNLHDHVVVPLEFIVRNTSEVFMAERDLTLENFQYYNKFGDGPYTTYAGFNVQAFMASSHASDKNTRKPGGWADIQLNFLQSSRLPAGYQGLLTAADMSEEEVAVATFVALVRPKSRGWVTLNTTDLNGVPVIDFQYLTDERDMDVLLQGIKLALKVYEETPSYQQHGARYPKKVHPSCQRFPFRTDEYWRCFIRQVSSTWLHAAGSCRMGLGSHDKQAVVDSQLRVLGVKNLRVADATIMPEVVNGNTQVAVYVIAEKVAEDILHQWEGLQATSWVSTYQSYRKE